MQLAKGQHTIKTFVFEKQQTQQTDFVQASIDSKAQTVDLSQLLGQYSPPDDHTISIYDPISNQFKYLHKITTQKMRVPRKYVQPTFVLIKYRRNTPGKEQESMNPNDEQQSSKNKDNRSKERSIAEVIALVKHWRTLHMTAPKPNNPKKKMNLQEAAKQVGISKKSLDDYYCQLRLAELHNFNFADNMHEKMGRLRAYVKEHRVDEAIRIRHHKHPKTLSIIEQFEIDKEMEEYIKRERIQAMEDYQSMKEESNHILENTPIFNEKFEPKIYSFENSYMEDFEFLMDDPVDPFLFQQTDFKKKIYESESEDLLFL